MKTVETSQINFRSVFTSFRHQMHENYGIEIPSLTTILIWALGIAFAISLTIKDFLPLLSEYRDNNYATQVNVVQWDDQFKPPQLVVTLPRSMIRNKYGNGLMALAYYQNGNGSYDAGKMIYDKLNNVSWDIWNDPVKTTPTNRDSLETVYSNLSLATVHRLFNMSIDSENLFDQEYNDWNEPLVTSFMNYLEWQAQADYYLYYTQPDPINKFDLAPSPDLFQDIGDYGTKLSHWSNRTFERICGTLGLGYTELEQSTNYVAPRRINRTCTDWLLGAASPVFLSVEGLWAALPPMPIPKIMQYHFTYPKAQNDPYLLEKLGSDPSDKITLYPDSSVLYMNSMDPPFTTYIFEVPFEKSKAGYMITVRYSVQIRTKETRSNVPCQNGTTKASSCFVQCTKVWFIQKCNCIPFTFKSNLLDLTNESMPYCEMMHYMACNLTTLPTETREQCTRKCQAACDFTTYNWQINYETFEPKNDTTEVILKMVPVFDTFAEFSKTTKNTPEQFFSQLAGLGNFYLGFSGLTLFALAASCLEWYRNYRKLKMKNIELREKADDLRMKHGNQYDNPYVTGYPHWLVGLKLDLKAEIKMDLKAEIKKELKAELMEELKRDLAISERKNRQ